MPAVTQSEISLLHLARVVWRHKGKMLACFVAVVGIATVAALFWPKSFRSEGKLLVGLGRENMAIDPTATIGATPMLTVQPSRENEINSIIEIMHSRVLIEKVVDAIGPGVLMESGASPTLLAYDGATSDTALVRAAAIRMLSKSLTVEAARKSDVVLISYDAGSPALAQSVVSRMIEYFLEEHVRLNRTPGAQEFLAKQTAEIRQRLQDKETDLRKLQDETGLADATAQRTIVVNRIGRLEDDLLQASTALSSIEAEVARLQEQLKSLPEQQVHEQTVGMPNQAADGMRQQLYALEMREQELATKFTDDHPQLQQVRSQIADAKGVLDHEQGPRTETKTGPGKHFEEMKLQLLKAQPELASLHAKADRLQSQLADKRAGLEKLNNNELRIARLQRDLQLEEANYRKYSESLEQSRIDRAMAEGGKSNVNIVQPASFDPKPVKPNKLLTLAAGIILGALGALGLAFAAESWDDSFRNSDDVERHLDLPVLANLPRLNARQLQPLEKVASSAGVRS